MLLHISARRNIALDLVARGLVTQAEAASLIGESRQAMNYHASNIDAKTARAKYLANFGVTRLRNSSRQRVRSRTRSGEKKKQ